MKHGLIIVVSMLWIFLFAGNEQLHADSDLFSFEDQRNGEMIVNFETDDYNLQTISKNGQNYTKVIHESAVTFVEKGKPELPRFSQLITIPQGADVEVEIISMQERTISNVTPYPFQSFQLESSKDNTKFEIDEEFYAGSEIFPTKITQLDEPAIMRDLQVVNLTVNPVRYNAGTKELTIITNITVKIKISGGKNNPDKLSRAFLPLYKSSILNFTETKLRTEDIGQPTYLFIYPDNDDVFATLEILLDWKIEKGFNVVCASTAETGITLNQIKSYIQDAYDNWENKPDFICLVGDASGSFNIPTAYTFGGEGDHYYTMLEGGDILADAFIGRLSFNTITELQTIVSKILHYEKEPYLEQTEWYEKALLVGDPSDSGTSTIDTNIFIKDMILQHNPDFDITEVYFGPWVSQMANGLNGGVSYFNYRGFAGMSGWGNGSTYSLNNGFMLPLVVSLTCNTGNFASGTSYSEAFLKAGSPSVPIGGIAAVATATPYTHTCFNNIVAAGIHHGIFSKGIYNPGGALVHAKNELYRSYPGNPYDKVTQFSYWNNLMGDPGMELWTAIPEEMSLDAPTEINVGNNFTEILVTDLSHNILIDAWVTIVMNDIQTTAFSDENGFVLLPFEPEETGTATLTVTKHNFIPNISEINIIESELYISSTEIQIDDSAGNNDGNINAGEKIDLNVCLKNFGSLIGNNINAVLSCESADISITNNSVNYGQINAGEEIFPETPFSFTVGGAVYGGQEIVFDMEINDSDSNVWNDNFVLNMFAPNLVIINYEIQGNGVIEPGESANLTITLDNIGQVSGNSVTAQLACSDNRITITDDYGSYGDIDIGENVENETDQFTISANETLITGMQIPFELYINDSTGYDEVQTFLLMIGEISVDDPLGPDEYGYFCYDDGDVGYDEAPEYDWIDISSTGTNLNFIDYGNTGHTATIDLPIEFRFYGEAYDQLSICSNGWAAPGSTENESFMNWNIPGALGPSPMIAVFWDDLKTGTVYFQHDIDLNVFIVQWENMLNEYNNNIETFQVIIYDVSSYPTPLGDSFIKMQYKEVHNVDAGEYWSMFGNSHGLYATVGIENPNGTIGIGYTCNNQYPTAAKQLQNEMAIVFTNVHLSLTESDNNEIIPANTSLYSNYPNPFNPTTTISFSVAQSSSFVNLDVYNLKGQKVKQLVSDELTIGQHSVVWDGKDESGKGVSSGIYFYKLRAGTYTSTKKMILLK